MFEDQHDYKEVVGRWTNEEHDLFLQGLRAYGKDWKRIANLVKTRTVVQIRTHAQKFFLGKKCDRSFIIQMNNNNNNNNTSTNNDDNKFVNMIKKRGAF